MVVNANCVVINDFHYQRVNRKSLFGFFKSKLKTNKLKGFFKTPYNTTNKYLKHIFECTQPSPVVPIIKQITSCALGIYVNDKHF